MSAAAPPTTAEVYIADRIRATADGWMRFDDFLQIALHHPQHGYYGSGRVRFGSEGDFDTAPTITPLFGETIANIIAPILQALQTSENGGDILELGAGDGHLAEQICTALRRHHPALAARTTYTILETAAPLRTRQQERLARLDGGQNIRWVSTLPPAKTQRGVIIANEVLDCVPFRLFHNVDTGNGNEWSECGVVINENKSESEDGSAAALLTWCDRPPAAGDTLLATLPAAATLPAGYTTEASEQAPALCCALCESLEAGIVLLGDYGFSHRTYYHPQRSGGTMLCHHRHRTDANPLANVGNKDITAHVNWTAIATAGHAAGLHLAGYTAQAHFLLNGGILDGIAHLPPTSKQYAQATAAIHRLTAPHEMGESIKWLTLTTPALADFPLPAFHQNQTHHL